MILTRQAKAAEGASPRRYYSLSFSAHLKITCCYCIKIRAVCFKVAPDFLPSVFHVSTSELSQTLVKKLKRGTTPSLHICCSNNRSIPQSARRLWLLLRQLGRLLSIHAPDSNVNTTSLGLCHQKNPSSLISEVGEQVAFLQRATNTGNTVWNAAAKAGQPVHGPAGHLSAAGSSF